MASEVWNYFIIDVDSNGFFAKCNLCSKLISRGASKSTSNMKKHLLKVHSIKLKSEQQFKGQSTLSKMLKSVDESPKDSSKDSMLKFLNPQPHFSQSLITETDLDLDDPSSSRPSSDYDLLNLSTSTNYLSPISTSSCTSTDLQSLSGSSEICISLGSSNATDISPRSSHYPKPKVIKLCKRKNQPTLFEMCDKISKFKNTDPRSKQITKLIAEMICLDLQPFSIVENKGFRNLLSHLEPRFTIPCRKILANKIIPEMYFEISKSIKEEMKGVQYVALTTDMWTSISGNDYMALTCHYFSPNCKQFLEIQHKCLEVVPFPEVSHTAQNLMKFLTGKIEEWSLTDKVVAIVRDNGPDIKAALNISTFNDVSCTAHTLQLVIKDGFLGNARISNLISKCKKLVGNFKHSAKNTKILRRCQKQMGIPEHRLIQDEPTRWNSTLHMLQRLLEQKKALVMATSSGEINCPAELTMDDWRTIEASVEILEIFDTATFQLSKESSTISEVS